MGSLDSPHCTSQSLLSGLRDFFSAADEAGLERAYRAVAQELPQQELPDASDVDWEQTLFGFNKLFVGPMALLAPPYASVWLEPEPQLMGASTLDARHVYQMLGLESPLKGKQPDDHVSLELDALFAMEVAMQAALDIGSPAEAPKLLQLREHFLRSHVLRWMPRFCEQVLELETSPPAVAAMAGELLAWLQTVEQTLNQDGRAQDCAPDRVFPTSDTPEVRS